MKDILKKKAIWTMQCAIIATILMYFILFFFYLYILYQNLYGEMQGTILQLFRWIRICIIIEVVILLVNQLKEETFKKKLSSLIQGICIVLILYGSILWVSGIYETTTVVNKTDLFVEKDKYQVCFDGKKMACTQPQYEALKESEELVTIEYLTDSLRDYHKILSIDRK